MPRTVNEGFQDFLKKLTPSSYESEAAKRHRASIEACIEANFGLNRFWRTGSFGNGTSISGHSDVDYMASVPEKSLKTNSSTSLTEFRSALTARFPTTGVKTSCPAVVVPFGTDGKETTEVTPAFLHDDEGTFKVYGIPNCSGAWMKASPDAHNDYVRSTDKNLSKKVKPLVRFIKAWKYFQNVPISSFYLELRVTNYASSESSIVYPVDVRRIFTMLKEKELASIHDPMGVSGLISPCKSDSELETAKSKVSTALSRAVKACTAEAESNTEAAFYWWNLLYSNNFPGYSR